MLTIVSDLDGCLADLNDELRARVFRDFGLELPIEEMNDKLEFTDYVKKHNIDKKWVEKVFKDEWLYAKATPIDNNIKRFRAWADEGHDVHILTARESTFQITTKGWVRKYLGPNIKTISHDKMLKYEYLQQVDATIFIEDLFFEANKAAAFGFPSFVIRQPWNKKFESRVITNPLVKFVNDFDEIQQHIEEGILNVSS